MLYMGVPVPGHLRMAERATLHTRMASSGELLLLSEVVMVTCLSFEPCDAHLSSAHPLDSLQGPPFCGTESQSPSSPGCSHVQFPS